VEIVNIIGLKSRGKSLEDPHWCRQGNKMQEKLKNMIQNYKNEEHPLGVDTGYLVKSY
jgi:hypothetical protein